ncbi:MAG: M15 family metallopeptidase [Fimbriimonadia bacterium]|nr:M15 family metallopeptidase [Fimbriimonadia bacterium]
MRVIREGMKGADVKRWQSFLLGQGFNPGIIDGDFGPKTHQATVAFQTKHKLFADGIVGIQTMGKAMMLGYPALKEDPTDLSELSPNFPPKPSFEPLTGTAARQKLFGKFAYKHSPTDNNPERIVITDDWEANNIVSVVIPQLIGVQGAPSDGKIRFHRLAVPQLKALWQAWEDAGLLPLVKTWAGSYVPRFVRGSRTTLSNHAFGTAFDINVKWNMLGAQPALTDEEGSVRKLVPLAHKHGFYWGGHFTRKDGMHFEIAFLK